MDNEDLQNRIKALEAECDSLKEIQQQIKSENLDLDYENRELKAGVIKLAILLGKTL